jgi:probable phosphoglycerate mutase
MNDAFHVLILRHGETDSNAGGVMQGWLPVPLNDRGRAQSRRLAKRLTTFVPRIRRLVSSDLERARQTAQPIAAALNLAPVFDPRWRERGLGEMEGQTIGERETWRAASGEIGAPGAEPLDAFLARAGSAFESLRAEYPNDSAVAVVAHGGTIRSVLHHFITGRFPVNAGDRAALDSPDLQTIANCSILHLTLRGAIWRVACANDVAHLETADDGDDDSVTTRDAG